MEHKLLGVVVVGYLALGCGSGISDPMPGDDGTGGGENPGGDGIDSPDAPNTPGEKEVDCNGDCEAWCDSGTWGGGVPTSGTDVVIPSGKKVLVDCDAEAASIHVEAGGALKVDRNVDTTLTVWGNILVEGRLDYGTPDSRVTASVEIVFAGVDNSGFVGAVDSYQDYDYGKPDLEFLESDTGLWVLGEGLATAAGVAKRSWSFLTATASGSSSFKVSNSTGWEEGDTVIFTPTGARGEPNLTTAFDEAVLAQVGENLAVEGSLQYEHLGCTDCLRRGEVANLTRNVVIRSADSDQRPHISVGQSGALQFDSVEIHSFGPSRDGGSGCQLVTGRLAVNFQTISADALPSFLKHVTIRNSQNGAVMGAYAHDVEITDVVSYDVGGAGAFLFPRLSEELGPGTSDRFVLTDVLAAKSSDACRSGSGRWGAINLPDGNNSGCRRCVSTGVSGSQDDGGFFHTFNGPAFFEDSIAHNNATGFVNWGSFGSSFTIRGMKIWSSGSEGLFWGPYVNDGNWDDATIVDSGTSVVIASAVGSTSPQFTNMTVDEVAATDYTLPTGDAHTFINTTFTGESEIGFTQLHDACSGSSGDENDPDSDVCTRVYFVIKDPVFHEDVSKPLDFGWTKNAHSYWEIRGFSHPNPMFDDMPANFDLRRRNAIDDNSCLQGTYNASFGACVVAK